MNYFVILTVLFSLVNVAVRGQHAVPLAVPGTNPVITITTDSGSSLANAISNSTTACATSGTAGNAAQILSIRFNAILAITSVWFRTTSAAAVATTGDAATYEVHFGNAAATSHADTGVIVSPTGGIKCTGKTPPFDATTFWGEFTCGTVSHTTLSIGIPKSAKLLIVCGIVIYTNDPLWTTTTTTTTTTTMSTTTHKSNTTMKGTNYARSDLTMMLAVLLVTLKAALDQIYD